MGLLDKLKSLLGLGDGQSRGGRSGQPNVTVEHEPAPGNEAAVKGTADRTGEADEAETPAGTPSPDADGARGSTAAGPGTTPAGQDATAGTEPGEAPASPAESGMDSTGTGAEPQPEPADAGSAPAEDQGPEKTGETEETDEPGEPTDDAGEGAEAVDSIRGIGPTYAGRLESAGIETVADLAAADAGTVAEAAETSESRATDWIEQAQSG
jgi:predicted flap endonuclease-1-like 5' DNA nuclease